MLLIRSFYYCLLLTLTASLSLSASASVFDESFDDYVKKSLEEWEVPGVAIGVIQGGDLIFSKGYGVRKVNGDDAVDVDTAFAIGSSTKAFTSAALAVLVDEGKLKWDDRVIDHLPWFAMKDPYAMKELTVRDLLCHRLGLPAGAGDILFLKYDRQEIVRRLRHMDPSSSFRSQFAYQNLSYLVAGELVESISGLTWDDFIENKIFKPLGMENSNAYCQDGLDDRNIAQGHFKLGDQHYPSPANVWGSVGPAGSMISNVPDMAKWIMMHLNDGSLGDEQFLSSSQLNEMHFPQMVVPLTPKRALYNPGSSMLAYGLGWFLSDYAGHKMVSHGGNLPGMTARVSMIPEKKLGVVVLSNQDHTGISYALSNVILDKLLDKEHRDWSSEILFGSQQLLKYETLYREKALGARVPNTELSHAISDFTGTYASELFGEAEVFLEGDQLMLKYGRGISAKLHHWHYDTFVIEWDSPVTESIAGKTLVSFSQAHDGSIRSVSVLGLMQLDKV